jgi:hypothetical protein
MGQPRCEGCDRCDQSCKRGPNGGGLCDPRFPNELFFHCGMIGRRHPPDFGGAGLDPVLTCIIGSIVRACAV